MFKLPEQYRDLKYTYSPHGGAFNIPAKGNIRALKILASDGTELETPCEHVSVSLNAKKISERVPNWYEMCFVKSLFWDDEDLVLQYHVPASKHISLHPGVLHLWRWPTLDIKLPPEILV